MNQNDMNPITEDDIANFLVNTPDFFERHAPLLATIKLTSPHGQRAISLQERQAEMLRDKIRVLELRLMDMVRHGTENDVLNERLQRWVKALLTTTQARDLPQVMVDELKHEFMVPQVAIKVWGVHEDFAKESFAKDVSDSTKSFAQDLQHPYVGLKAHEEVLAWLDADQVQSMAVIVLRDYSQASHAAVAVDLSESDGTTEIAKPIAPAIGMLVLASPDAQRYHEGMGTALLERLGELASAALSHLR